MKIYYSLKKSLVCIFAILCFISISINASASHFRFGYITATQLSETPTNVTYRLNVSTSLKLERVLRD